MKANSNLGLTCPQVRLFHDRAKCKRFLKNKLRVKAKFFDTSGQMFYHDGYAVVLMEHEGRAETELSLLVHEAYHAAVAHMEWIGENEAGEETMAYLVQTIANGLFVAHNRWKSKRSRLQA